MHDFKEPLTFWTTANLPAKLSQSAQGSCRPTGALMPPVPAVTLCGFNDFIAAIPALYPQSLKSTEHPHGNTSNHINNEFVW